MRVEPPAREMEIGARQAFRDALFALLSAAARRPGRPAICHAAEALRDVVADAPVTLLHAVVRRSDGHPVRLSGATAPDPEDPAVELTPREAEAWRAASPPGIAPGISTHEVDAGWRIAVSRARTGGLDPADTVLLLGLPRRASARELEVRRAWLASYEQGLHELLDTLEALDAAALRAALERQVDALVQTRAEQPFDGVLVQAAGVLESIVAGLGGDDVERSLDLVERLGAWATHHALGTGWFTDHDGRTEGALRAFAWWLARAATDGADPGRPAGWRARALRLRLLALTLHPTPDRPLSEPPHAARRPRAWRDALDALHPRHAPTSPADWLLAAWTGVHAAVDRYARSPGDAGPPQEELWTWVVDRTPALLADLLADAPEALAPARLALWFALDRLRQTDGARALGSAGRRWSTRASLAWVLRESLRRVVRGQHADFVWQPERYDDATFDLLELAAHDVLGLPTSFDLRGGLSALGAVAPRGLAAAHRRHVVEVCLTGQLLLDVHHAQDDGALTRLDGHLAAPDGPARPADARRLRAAWALAATHHDLGHLLLDPLTPHPPWPPTLALPADALAPIAAHRNGDRAALLARCRADLEAANLTGDLAAAAASPAGAHALAGAWLLLHHGRAGRLDDAVLAPALRAILLHALPDHPVDVGRDPVAALLVLCDQLHPWAPSAPHGGRRQTRRVRLDGLTIAAATDAVRAVLSTPEGPSFTVALQHPELSGTPTWRSWLTASRSLGRLRAAGGWRPVVRLVSPVPAWLAARRLHTFELLDRVAARPGPALRPLAAGLRDWLAEDAFVWDPEDRTETLRVHPLHLPLDTGALDALDAAITALVG